MKLEGNPRYYPPFWEFLGEWLREHDWTQVRLADELGVHQTMIGKWLHADPRRRILPGPRTERPLAEILGVTPSQLDAMLQKDRLRRKDALLEKVRQGVEAARADGALPMTVRAQLRSLDESFERWMSVMGPRMGGTAAEEAFWAPILASAKSHDKTARTLGAALNDTKHATLNDAVYVPSGTLDDAGLDDDAPKAVLWASESLVTVGALVAA